MNPGDLSREIVLDSHETSFLGRMNALRKESPEESFCDVSFNINGEEFPCHKLVLITMSSHFKKMFNGEYRERNCNNITMEGIEPEALEEVLTAIYESRFQVNRRNAFFILQASDMLDLTGIFEATERYIIENPDIDYLIDTCAFAKRVNKNDLYRKCISAIASDLQNQSKTNAFLKEEGKEAIMTFDIFLDVLSNENLIGDDAAVYQIIAKWCYSNKCSKEGVVRLLNSSDIKSGCMNTQSLARTIVQNYSDSEFGQITSIATSSPGTGSNKQNSDDGERVNYKVYLNTIDVETGAKGWALLQSQKEFNEFEVIHYEPSNSAYRKVKQIGNKLYCFDFDYKWKRNFFYHLENDKKTYLSLPTTSSKNFDIEVVANSIYLITEKEELWKYDLETNNWITVSIKIPTEPLSIGVFNQRRHMGFQQVQYENPAKNRPFDIIVDSCPKLASDGSTLYIVGLDEWDVVRVNPNQPVSRQNRIGHPQSRILVFCAPRQRKNCAPNSGEL